MKATAEHLPALHDQSFHAFSQVMPCFDHPYHHHPEAEISWITGGHGRRYVGRSSEPFGKGDLVLIAPQVPHLFFMDPKHSRGPRWASSHVVQFLPGMAGGMLLQAPELREVRRMLEECQGTALQFTDPASVRAAGRSLRRLVGATGLEKLLRLLELLQGLATSPRRRLAEGAEREASPFTELEMNRLDKIMRHLHSHFTEVVTLEELTPVAGLGPEALCRFLKRTTGRSFTQLLNGIRIAEVCRLLRKHRHETVQQIALHCGFHSMANFHTQFTRLTGTSPQAWRNSRG